MNFLLENIDAVLLNNDLTGIGASNCTVPEVFNIMSWDASTNSVPFKDKTQEEIFNHVVTQG